MQIEVILNDKKVVMDVDNDEVLADTLRRYGVSSVRKGCDTTNCGICTVLVEGKPVLSCSTLSFRMNGKSIKTTEGLEDEVSELAKFLAEEGADQCGFCSPGFILTVLAMKKELMNPTEKDILHYLTGNLCRCTGYMGQMRAVKKYMGVE